MNPDPLLANVKDSRTIDVEMCIGVIGPYNGQIFGPQVGKYLRTLSCGCRVQAVSRVRCP